MSSEFFDRQILSYLINFFETYDSRPKLLEKFIKAIDEQSIGGAQVEIIYSENFESKDQNIESNDLADQDKNQKFKVHIDGDTPTDKWNFAKYSDALKTIRDRIDNNIELPSSLKNLNTIASKYGFDDLDYKMLELFFVCAQLGLGHNLSHFDFVQIDAPIHFIAGALQADFKEVSLKLSPQGQLFKSGILLPLNSEEANRRSKRNSIFDVSINPRILSVIQGGEKSYDQIVEHFAGTTSPRKLSIENYPHFEDDIAIISGIVGNAIKKGVGADILLTGVHGTGKTQLVLVICEMLNLRVAQIGRQAIDEGRDLNRSEMLRDFLSLQILAQSSDVRLALFVDECERILSAEDTASQGITNKAVLGSRIDAKSTINFWACNDTSKADIAYLRRMDHIVDFDTPPIDARRAIITEACKRCGLSITQRQLINLSRLKIAPSLIDVAITGASLAEGEKYPRIIKIIESFAPKLYGESWEASGSIPEDFSPELKFFGFQGGNVPSWVSRLDNNLVAGKPITFLMAGPHGVGKTELARFLGEKLGNNTEEYDLPFFLPSVDTSTSEEIKEALKSAKQNNNLLVIKAPLAEALKYEVILHQLTQNSRDKSIPICLEIQCHPEEFDQIPKLGVTYSAKLLPLQGKRIDEAFEHFFGDQLTISISEVLGNAGLVVGEAKLAAERLKLLGITQPSRDELMEAVLSGQTPKEPPGFKLHNIDNRSEPR